MSATEIATIHISTAPKVDPLINRSLIFPCFPIDVAFELYGFAIYFRLLTEMHETASELHLKMCKKVAQLTRVIFYLNTKNDDYENNLKSVVHAYEHELDSTIKEVTP